MKRLIKRMFFLLMILYASLITYPGADVRAADTTSAVVTYLDGSARVFSKGSAAGLLLKKNARVGKNQEIRVGDRSRIALRFPDGTIMRFAERSVIRMEDISFDSKTKKKSLLVEMGMGKLWASVKRLFSADSKVEVKTVNAVAGVRGTVYRVNVNEDTSAMVKVYDGSVYVDGVQRTLPAASPPAGGGGPVPVPGPREVPPPYHEVTMEEWHVIVKSFQQITISPQGEASEPKEFDPQQDLDDWVKWNQDRDRTIEK